MEPSTLTGIGAASGMIGRLLGDLKLTKIQAAHIALIQEQVGILEKRNAELDSENIILKNQLKVLNEKLSAATRSEEFVEHRGVLFKRKPEGGFQLAVYCPKCKTVMGAISKLMRYSCQNCSTFAPFNEAWLRSAIAEIQT